MINGLDLFSGIGGIALGLAEWVRPVAYCEIDRYCQGVLLSRMHEGSLPAGPIWDDVRTLSSEHIGVPIDIITGGFPCQDISVAGSGAGLDGERSSLFFEITRLCGDLRPRFVFLENVPAITLRGLDRVLMEFTALGYDCRWTTVSAAELGAPHIRHRWFLLAHTDSPGVRNEPEWLSGRRSSTVCAEGKDVTEHHGSPRSVGDTNGERSQGERYTEKAWRALTKLGRPGLGGWPSWIPEPSLCRGHDGLSQRVDRTRALGNAVVPAQAREAFRRLISLSS